MHVEPTEHSELLQDEWERYVERPFREAGRTRRSSTYCRRHTALSLFPQFNLFSISPGRIPNAASWS